MVQVWHSGTAEWQRMVLFSRAPRAYTAHGFGTSSGAPSSGHSRSSLVATHARRGDARPSRGALDEHAARRREPPLPALAPLLLQARSAQRGRAVAVAVGFSRGDDGGRGREREVRRGRDVRLGRRRRRRASARGATTSARHARAPPPPPPLPPPPRGATTAHAAPNVAIDATSSGPPNSSMAQSAACGR